MLDWLGDCGGLLDALNFIAQLLLNPYSLYALQSKLSLLLVKFKPSDTDVKNVHSDLSKTKNKGVHDIVKHFGKLEKNH